MPLPTRPLLHPPRQLLHPRAPPFHHNHPPRIHKQRHSPLGLHLPNPIPLPQTRSPTTMPTPLHLSPSPPPPPPPPPRQKDPNTKRAMDSETGQPGRHSRRTSQNPHKRACTLRPRVRVPEPAIQRRHPPHPPPRRPLLLPRRPAPLRHSHLPRSWHRHQRRHRHRLSLQPSETTFRPLANQPHPHPTYRFLPQPSSSMVPLHHPLDGQSG